MKNETVIFLLQQHYRLGWIIESFLAQKNETDYQIIEKYQNNSTANDILTLIESYSEQQLYKVFGKKYRNQSQFISQLDEQLFAQQIRPFIDRRIDLIIKQIQQKGYFLALKNHKTTLTEDDALDISLNPVKPRFIFNKHNQKIEYSVDFQHSDQPFDVFQKKLIFLTNAPCYFILGNIIYYTEKIDQKKLAVFTQKKALSIPLSSENEYIEKFILPCIREYPTRIEGLWYNEDIKFESVFLKIADDLKGSPVLELYFKYGPYMIKHASTQKVLCNFETSGQQKLINIFRRDIASEKRKVDWLLDNGLFTNDYFFFYPTGEFSLNYEKQLENIILWINNNTEILTKQGIILDISYISDSYYLGKTTVEIEKTEQPDWFDIYGSVIVDDFEIPVIRLRDQILQGIRYIILPSGKKLILPDELFGRFRELMRLADIKNNIIRLSKKKINQNDFSELLNLTFTREEIYAPEQPVKIVIKPVPDGFTGKLRHYQEFGYSWLSYLSLKGLGGCLADDMGLGKTIQVICLLLEAKNIHAENEHEKIQNVKSYTFQDGDNKLYINTSLIVVPLSLIYNWNNEIRKFAPSLSVYIHSGTERIKDIQYLSKFDVVLTTYGTLRNDCEILSNAIFRYIILDESQYIKNHRSVTYKALLQLKALNRFTLTGTPVENSLSDLWSQLNFINPGYLGNFTYFNRRFILPVENQNDKEKAEELRKLTEKFILRRTKEEVEPDLPPVNEQMIICSFNPEQKKIYESYKSEARNAIWASLKEKGIKKSTFVILESLLRLRQIANHPLLIDENTCAGSGKFDQIISTIENIVLNRHKVLIFSSFVSHLELIKNHLKSSGIGFCMITGETRNRESEVNQFISDETKMVFLLSIKAAGTGLNLTAADYVMILEPWWNPAVEDQALSRAHRIGQTKKVIVLKFITEGSIEEKIIRLQERKKNLVKEIITESDFLKKLSEEDMNDLFDK